MKLTAYPFIVVRTPLLPARAFISSTADLEAPFCAPGPELAAALERDHAKSLARLDALARDPVIREAVYLASPSVDDALRTRDADPDDPRAADALDVFARYVARMATRSTPFGTFAGYGRGTVGAATSLHLEPLGSCRRRVRVDSTALAALVDTIEERARRARASEDDVTDASERLSYRPNDSLQKRDDTLSYVEPRAPSASEPTDCALAVAARSPALDDLLAAADGGATFAALADHVMRANDVALEDARAFVAQAIENGLLVSDLRPAAVGPEPLGVAIQRLDGASPDDASALREVERRLRALEAMPLGVSRSTYEDAVAPLRARGAFARRDLLRVDLERSGASLTLGKAEVDALGRALEVVSRFALHEEHRGLRAFKDAFVQRYEEEWELAGTPLSARRGVPLVEALDPELGIGFGTTIAADASALLDGFEFPEDPTPAEVRFGAAEQALLDGLTRTLHAGATEWVLDDADVARLSGDPQVPFPESVAVTATVLGGAPRRLLVHAITGPSAATRLGRFCRGDEALAEQVDVIVKDEEARRPDVVFAEIVHDPGGRDTDVVGRPSFRGHAVTYLGRVDDPSVRTLPIDDLRLTIDRGRLVLFSAALGREVAPRLTVSHNVHRSALPIVHFLYALQHGRDERDLGWSWRLLAASPFLPRVRLGDVVLAAARWTLRASELQGLGEGTPEQRYLAARALRAARALPQRVAIVEGDALLPIDLDTIFGVDQLARAAKRAATIELRETFLDEAQLVAISETGALTHEVIVPFAVAAPPATVSAPPPSRTRVVASPPRHDDARPPGSEWLFAKIYTGTDTADALLIDALGPLARALGEGRVVDRWFFVRYRDPDWHLRVRFRGDPTRLVSEALPALRDALAPWLSDGRVFRFVLDTYRREVERYGGPDAIDVAETIFEVDSDATVEALGAVPPEEREHARWRLALASAHRLFVDFGFDATRALAAVASARDRFAAEHFVDTAFRRQLGARFREHRDELEELVRASAESIAWQGALDRRSARIAPLVRYLRDLARRGQLVTDLDALVLSFVHMQANRVLRADHRAHEVVLYDWLARLYTSRIARSGGSRPHTLVVSQNA